MPLELTIPTRNSVVTQDDAIEKATSKRSSQLRPTSWINYQHEKQRSSELKRARQEVAERQNEGRGAKSETPMIARTSALFKKLFGRGARKGQDRYGISTSCGMLFPQPAVPESLWPVDLAYEIPEVSIPIATREHKVRKVVIVVLDWEDLVYAKVTSDCKPKVATSLLKAFEFAVGSPSLWIDVSWTTIV